MSYISYTLFNNKKRINKAGKLLTPFRLLILKSKMQWATEKFWVSVIWKLLKTIFFILTFCWFFDIFTNNIFSKITYLVTIKFEPLNLHNFNYFSTKLQNVNHWPEIYILVLKTKLPTNKNLNVYAFSKNIYFY